MTVYQSKQTKMANLKKLLYLFYHSYMYVVESGGKFDMEGFSFFLRTRNPNAKL